MQTIFRCVFIMTLLLLPSLVFGATWTLDPDHCNIQFSIRHLMMSNVKGVFQNVQGTIVMDDKDPSNMQINVSIDTGSLNTGVIKRDTHLKSADFFDVAKYPAMTFISKKVTQTGKDHYKVLGDLSLHGIKQEVVLDVNGPTTAIKDPWGKMRRGASAATTINRKDFGIVWNMPMEAGGMMVGDEVLITLELEAVMQ